MLRINNINLVCSRLPTYEQNYYLCIFIYYLFFLVNCPRFILNLIVFVLKFSFVWILFTFERLWCIFDWLCLRTVSTLSSCLWKRISNGVKEFQTAYENYEKSMLMTLTHPNKFKRRLVIPCKIINAVWNFHWLLRFQTAFENLKLRLHLLVWKWRLFSQSRTPFGIFKPCLRSQTAFTIFRVDAAFKESIPNAVYEISSGFLNEPRNLFSKGLF